MAWVRVAYYDDAVLKKDVDDTPVNGETAAPISSNWAYDHNAATTGVHGAGASTLVKATELPQIILDVFVNNGGTSQVCPTTKNIIMKFDSEIIDSLNAFDSSVKAGTCAGIGATAGHLIDTTLSPFVAGDVGRRVWNTTDNTYTYITVYNSASDVTVHDDIFDDGETYSAYFCKFTAPSAMEVFVFARAHVLYLADAKYLQLQILKNGATAASELRYFSGASQLGLVNMAIPIILAANDYIQADVFHNVGSNQNIYAFGGQAANYMRIVKIRDV